MVALRTLVPGVIRRSHAAKLGLVIFVLGLSMGTIGYAGGMMDDEVALLLIGASLVLVFGIGAAIGRTTSREIDTLSARAEAIEAGDLDVEIHSPRIDSVGQLADVLDRMRETLREQRAETAAASESELQDEQVAKAQADVGRLEQTALDYAATVRTCADGDLTARMDADVENEAMAELATEFNDLISDLESTAEELTALTGEVATTSQRATADTEALREGSQEVTDSLQEITGNSRQQSGKLGTVTQKMDSLSRTTEEIAASSNTVADLASQTAETGEEGRKAARAAIEGMSKVEAESQEAVEEINRLEAEMQQIDQLLEFITEIAEQTNMLALNANIEAARSGSSGEGFAVVAGEVKDLSEETKEAAATIEDRLERIKSQTERTAKEVQTTSAEVSMHTGSIERAVDALDDITEYAEATNDGIEEISAASEQQAAATEDVVIAVDDAADLSAETTVASEAVTETTREQTDTLGGISRDIHSLTRQAITLSETVGQFHAGADLEDLGIDADAVDAAGDALLEGIAGAGGGADATVDTGGGADIGTTTGAVEPESGQASVAAGTDVDTDSSTDTGTGTDADSDAKANMGPTANEVIGDDAADDGGIGGDLRSVLTNLETGTPEPEPDEGSSAEGDALIDELGDSDDFFGLDSDEDESAPDSEATFTFGESGTDSTASVESESKSESASESASGEDENSAAATDDQETDQPPADRDSS